MSGKFTVDPQALANVVAQIRNNAEEYNSIATQLLETATTIDAAYAGEEKDAFVDQVKGCGDDLKAMVTKLNQIAEIVKAQKEGYETVSDHNKVQVRKLQN